MASEKTLQLRKLESELATRARPLPTPRDVGGDGVVLHPVGAKNRAQKRAEARRDVRNGNAFKRLADVTGHNERTAMRMDSLEALEAFKAKKITREQAKRLGAFDKLQRVIHRAQRIKREELARQKAVAEALRKQHEEQGST